MSGYNSIFEQYSDLKYIITQYITEYLEYKHTNMPADPYGGWDAYATRPDRFGLLYPFVLSQAASARVEQRLAKMTEKTEDSTIFLPFEHLCGSFALDDRERLMVAACFLPFVYPELSETYAFINNNTNLRFLTLASAAAVFFAGDAQRSYSAMKRFVPLLFDIDDAQTDFSRVELKPSKRIQSLLLGAELLYNLPCSETFAVSGDIGEIFGRDEELGLIEAAVRSEHVILIEGASGMGKRYLIKHAGKRCRKNIIFADLNKIADGEIRRTANELRREMILQLSACCFTGLNAENSDKAERLIDGLFGYTIFLCTEDRISFKKTAPYRILLKDLSYEDKLRIWKRVSLPEDMQFVEKLAAAYSFGPSKISKVISDCEAYARLRGTDVNAKLLERACLDASEGILEGKAARINTTFKLNDLILPPREKSLITEGINFIKYRHRVFDNWNFASRTVSGRGLSMLFEGSPGTGKTMAASVVANELGLPLFKVDLSKMMSKYIGETEKSLDEVFNIAERNSAVLLFDETDALFGKRSEIKDSHDKYANVETSFLLQKMDEFSGMIIMTTNFKQNIDDAFMRRITYIVHFPAPDGECRYALWKSAFPPEAPLDRGVDLKFLAERFEMTGAMIVSAAIAAAFTAAAEDRNISMADIIPAVKNQFAKFGKIISPSEFGPYAAYAGSV